MLCRHDSGAFTAAQQDSLHRQILYGLTAVGSPLMFARVKYQAMAIGVIMILGMLAAGSN